jgi:alginate O-acetyltransferase complex protein AlgI
MDTPGMAPAGAFQGLPLNSCHFLLLGLVAVVALRTFRHGRIRHVLVLALNLYFFHFFVSGWLPWSLVGALGVVTYGCGLLRRSPLGCKVPGIFWIAIVVGLWAFLFLVKDPGLLRPVNPFHHFPVVLIGISYMVFRCIGFVMDAEVLERVDPLTFFNYLLFFPTFLAGPIERFERFEELHEGKDLNLEESPLPGLHRMANGFLKKFVLADSLAAWSLAAMNLQDPWPTPLLWVGVLLQPVVLYLDFSGYCDIMIGLVRLTGFSLAENFDAPWQAGNIQEFWNRWHITLSHFIRDYVYNPLLRQLLTVLRPAWQFPGIVILYFFTMVLLGLWHGTNLGFLLFGVFHGLLLVWVLLLNRWVYPLMPSWVNRIRKSRGFTLACRGLTFYAVALSMVIWVAGTRHAGDLILRMWRI